MPGTRKLPKKKEGIIILTNSNNGQNFSSDFVSMWYEAMQEEYGYFDYSNLGLHRNSKTEIYKWDQEFSAKFSE